MIQDANQKSRWSQKFCALLPAQFQPFVLGAFSTETELVVVVTNQSAAARLKSYRAQLLKLAEQSAGPAVLTVVVRIAKPISTDIPSQTTPRLRMPTGAALDALRAFAESMKESPLRQQMLQFFSRPD
jgi:hypothetical protein